MFNKKFLLIAAVATAVVGNANALEANGFNVSGGVGAQYDYSKDKLREVTNNGYELYRARVSLSKDLSNLAKGLSVSAQIDGKNTDLLLNTATVNYDVNDSLSLSAGSGYYGYGTFGDMTSSYRSAFTSLAGGSATGDYKTYGAELYYSAGNFSFTLNGGLRAGKDLLDTSSTHDGGSETTLFDSTYKEEKFGILAVRGDYLVNGLNVGVGLVAQNTYGFYNKITDNVDTTIDQDERDLSMTLDLSLSYAKTFGKNTLFAYVTEQADMFEPKLVSGAQKVTYTQLDLVGGLLFGVNGEFDNFGTVVKADNFVYFGAQYENISYKFEQATTPSFESTTTSTKITGVLGYAPNPNVVISAEYSVVKGEYDNGTRTVDTQDGQEAKLNVRLSF
ncbi:MAG: hypothetical protein Ta2D_11060 [Rickettsiales bacterium]|nr:MAG: hypothetical protein Ta2D_11060 [Rickettsiales bacterium]